VIGLETRPFVPGFDESGGPPDEMQTVTGDSGGGVSRAGEWQLVGVFYHTSLPRMTHISLPSQKRTCR
jgi:hypothetical protein